MAKTISVAAGKDYSNLQTLFTKLKSCYYNDAPITLSALSGDIQCEIEFPLIEGGVTFDTGAVDKTEIKLTNGTIWASRATKGDSDISLQVCSIAGDINDLFLTKKTSAAITGITAPAIAGKTFAGEGYALDVNKVTGSLVFTDDSRDTFLILTNVEMYASLKVADGDNPAYFQVSVTPRANTDGIDLMLFQVERT